MNLNIAIIGAGAWGTTIAKILSEKGFNAYIWAREKEVVNSINKYKENKFFLKDIKLPKNIQASNDLNYVLYNKDIIINAIPTQFIRNVFGFVNHKKINSYIISLSKGIELNTFKRPSEILKEIFKKDIYVLSGPNFASEIAQKKPAATTIAGKEKNIRKHLQNIFNTNYFRVYENDDIIGVEIAGAVKNVIAIASGMVEQLGYGNNTKAALITRGLNEIRKLGKKLGAKDITFMGLSGIGDLFLTCNSNISRNYTVGIKVAKGEKLEKILKRTNQIAEGVKTAKAVYELSNKIDVDMPITKEVYLVLYHNKRPTDALKSLMTRTLKSEF